MARVVLRPGHRLRLLQGGAALFPALVQAIERARRTVYLETYILDCADAVLPVLLALERAARRGVAVRLLADGVGTPHWPRPWWERLTRAGVACAIYAPLGRVGLLIPSRWRRLHRKLCVVDGAVGFCGGINLIDDRNDVALGRLVWPRLDFALQVSGPLVAEMQEAMERVWWRVQAVQRVRQRALRAAWQAWRSGWPGDDRAMWGTPGLRRRVPHVRAALLLRDNVRHRHDIERAYLEALATARHEVLLAHAYFIPGRRLRQALVRAAQRGVRVRVLLQGRYEHFLQYHAARPVHHYLLQRGVELYEYTPSALHAKVAVVDGRWATVGSSNLDPLSLLLAREANIATTDRALALQLQRHLRHLLHTAARALSVQALRQRPWRQRALDWLAFGTMRAVLWLSGHRY